MKLQVIGCSHHGSSVAVRERLAFSPAQIRTALETWRARFPTTEAVLLSTCNRVEMYAASQDLKNSPSHEEVVEFLADFHRLSVYEIFDDLFEHTGHDVARHLFTVAASLDSMVVGEPQILSQVKQAYQMANELESTGPLTHSVFQAAIKVARRVNTETAIHQRRVSIPSIAVAEFGSQIFEDFADKEILLIGAGEMGEETVRYLQEEGATKITVINRSEDRAVALAERCAGKAVSWDALHASLIKADVVISTTGATEPIVTLDSYKKHVNPYRFQRPIFILDLAMPRDFDPAIDQDHDCLGVYLYSIDDLAAACERNRKLRDKELPKALAIVEEEADSFMTSLYHRTTAPIIKGLMESWQEPKDHELRRLFNKLPDLDDRARKEIAQSFDRLVNKLLHPPLESLRDEARHGPPHGLLDSLKRLFQIKD